MASISSYLRWSRVGSGAAKYEMDDTAKSKDLLQGPTDLGPVIAFFPRQNCMLLVVGLYLW